VRGLVGRAHIGEPINAARAVSLPICPGAKRASKASCDSPPRSARPCVPETEGEHLTARDRRRGRASMRCRPPGLFLAALCGGWHFKLLDECRQTLRDGFRSGIVIGLEVSPNCQQPCPSVWQNARLLLAGTPSCPSSDETQTAPSLPNAMGSALLPPHKRPATTLTISLVFGVQLNLSIASATNETRAVPSGRPGKAHSNTRTRWIFGRLLE
jgi:hypothetical protein